MARKKIAKMEKGKGCSIPRMVGVAILLVIVAQTVHMIEVIFTMDYYLDPAYFGVWSKLMMPDAAPPPAEFYYYSLLFAFVTALIYVWAYHVIEPAMKVDGWANKGLFFGLLIFLLSTVPGTLSLYLLINLPSMLLLSWSVSGLVVALIDGLIIAKVC
jgi:hypothetical protein